MLRGLGAAAAPPRPAPWRPAASRPVPSRSVLPARSQPAPGAEAFAGAPCTAMAQHFCLASCDVVGFDLDHTLCRYNLPESALVSGAGRPGRTACSLHGRCGWSFLPASAAASAAGALLPPRLCAELGLPPQGWAEACTPGPRPCREHRLVSPSH